MKKGFNIWLILCASLIAISCSKTKSYTDMLKDEEKAIDRFKDKHNWEILRDFPADTVFKENQFVELEDGVYMNIIDRGSSQRAVMGKTKLLFRCKMHYILNNDTVVLNNYGPHSNGTLPYPSMGVESVPFTYGAYSSSSPADPTYAYVSEGMQLPLKYVGDHGKVKLLVPFKVGTYFDQGQGYPVFYEVLEYIFEENL